jgi:hypothetical protein
MKQGVDWTAASASYNPLMLHRLIEKTVLAQTEDQHPFATVHDQELSFYQFRQAENMSNLHWCKRFNTKIDIGDAIGVGVARQHKALLEFVAQEHAVGLVATTIDSLTDAVQDEVRRDAEERHVLHVFLRQSGPQHAKLLMDLHNNFTTGENKHPKTRQATLHLLDKHSKTALTKPTSSEGASFAQGGGGSAKGKKKEAFDKACWKDRTCYACNKKGHPANHCPSTNEKADRDDDAASPANSISELKKDFKKMSKAFAMVNARLEQLKESESDLSGSEGKEASHFQHNESFQFTQLESKFGPNISNAFKQAHGDKITLDLKNIKLLDSQSTMDLFCNKNLVQKIYKTIGTMRLKSDGGSMVVGRRATISGHRKQVWFSTDAIANIIALTDLIQQHRVTYKKNKKNWETYFRTHLKILPKMEGANSAFGKCT